MGDHARREMIVRITRVVRQNPAYRLSVLPEPPMLRHRRFFFLLRNEPTVKKSLSGSILILLSVVGCVITSTPRPQPAPTTPSLPQAPKPLPDSGPWAFNYRSDTLSYRINRSAIIESQTDSAIQRGITTNSTHEVLSLSVNLDTVRYTATVDTFSTAVQGLIGAVPPVALPVQISGSLDSAISPIDSAAPVLTCDPVQSSLRNDVHNLLVKIPMQFTAGTSWSDSTVRTSCYGTIPMSARVVRTFTVVGRIQYGGQSLVQLQRVDTIAAHGEGRQQQHQLTVDATGFGNVTYYLSTERNALIRLTTDQSLEFVIRGSGRSSSFRETAKAEYDLIR